jgi:uncharacterized repeat protein (TIGR01451 family)
MKHKHSATHFVDSIFTPLSLVLISIVAIIAVAVALFQVNRGTIAPTAPQQSSAADFTGQTCVITFDVAGPTVTPIPQVDLELEKSVNNSTPNVNDQVVFTLTVTNTSNIPATGVTVEDILPSGITYVSSSPDNVYDSNTGIWTIGNLGSGASTSLNITVTVNTTEPTTNYAQIETTDQEDIDSTPGDDSTNQDDDDSVTINPLPGADLSLIKNVNTTTPTINDNLTYTLDLTNDGPDTATNVTVEEILPEGLSFVSYTTTQGSYDSTTGIWTVGTLPNGATVQLTITATVNVTGTITNYAQVETSDQPDPDSTPGDDSTTDDDDSSTTVISQPTVTNTPTNTPIVPTDTFTPSPTVTPNPNADLSLTKYVSNSTPKVGENITYTITVYNAGPATATNVTVYEPLVGGTTFVSANPSQGSYNVSTGIWTIGTIPVNQTRTLQITVTMNVAGTVTNTAQVQTSDQPDPDSTPGNNNPNEDDQDSATTNSEQPGADLSLVKRVNNSTPVVGQNVTFTIEVRNSGPQQADGVSVRDLLPPGTTFVDAQPSQGSYNSGNGVWTIGTLTKDSTVTMLLTVRVDSSTQITNVAEVISSNQPDPDSTPNNNNPNEDDQDDAVLYPQTAAQLPRSGNASSTTLFVIATGVIVLIIGAMGLLLLL